MKISDGKVVSLTYDLTIRDDEGQDELMERAPIERPFTFIFGMGMVLDAFEKAVEGLEVGETFTLTLSPEEAQGEYDEEKVQELPKSIFEIDGKFDEEKFAVGSVIPMMNSLGEHLMGLVMEIEDDIVVMDFNEPYAGETLTYTGEVVDVHEATPEEIASITQPHGCNCSGCDSGDKEAGCGCGCDC
ncbi:FKBP-type peptidyl-prolyl cis-trans isomerase SlyD [Dysgonomonadaceae bacterium PH5-43]|nr:FKBP-type peptidyl-prolyl cis-trans isomerase SlyD [Dysgonomonadaceae bacterium PH5-43]